jgi:long-chain acyl-CoA synthetase
MLCHRNLVSNIDAVQDYLTIQPGDSDLQFLPMCHAFGRMEVYALIMHHGTVNFAESIEKLPANFKEVRPLFFVTVPRMLEKIYEKVVAGLDAASPLKRKLFWWAIDVGKRHTQHRMDKTAPGLLDRLQYPIADRLVFSKVKEAFGGRIRILGYAAAPLALEIQRFFAAAGIIAMEAYGLTETSPGLSGNKADDFRLGSVGKAVPDTEIVIAPDGEILARGPQVMLGYWNQPAATAEALEGGWFHTGDIGKFDADGFLWITDRKKDLIITAGGKNIAPQNIENLFKLSPGIEQIAVMGDRHSYLVALIVPSPEWLTKFAAERGLSGDRAALVKDPIVRAEFERLVAATNQGLAQYETIKKFELLAEEFNIENDLLTPTLKVRRKNVARRYADLIESMYK